MKIEEDKQFLQLQRTGRKGYMGNVGKQLAVEERAAKRKEAEGKRILKEKKRLQDAKVEDETGDLSSCEEMSCVDNTSLFVVLIYMEHWFLAPAAVSAPHSDLQFIKQLQAYRGINNDVAESALNAIMNHLWYLTEDLVGLAFFSK